jgi:hypothetical protein
MLYGQDRRALRAVFFRAWQRHRAGEPLEGSERDIVAVALRHPEYHALLESPERHAERDWPSTPGATNPFLHLALHLALEEQLALDRPPGVRAHYARLCRTAPDEHAAQHRMLGCLGEALQEAGRSGTAPDAQRYLDCLARLAGPPDPRG